jgi:hypothetical protein
MEGGSTVILSEAKDPAVLPSCLLVARITGADIARTIYRRVLRVAQDDRDSGDAPAARKAVGTTRQAIAR